MTLRPTPLARLVEARPRIEKGWLHFDCPFHGVHPTWGQCSIAIPLAPTPRGWGVKDQDDFEKITVTPSIKITSVAGECWWHGHITEGRFDHCGDSR